MRDGEYLTLKYNASLEKSIGLTVEEMALIQDNYLPNYLSGESNVPAAEVALLGVNVAKDQFSYYNISDLYHNRSELVAWEHELEVTPFEDSFKDTYRQMIFNISFDDIANDFIIEDETGTEHCYITDILITSNDPSYELVVDSFFIFEFDYNATMYNSELFDLYPYNHMEEFYFDVSDNANLEDHYFYSVIYDEYIILNCSGALPLYYFDSNINETEYFEAYGSRDNYYYIGEHLNIVNISESGVSEGIYNITWNPMYSDQFYYDAKHAKKMSEVIDLYDYYNPFISNYSYLYLSWADENSVYEWRTIDQPNIITDTIEVAYDYYDEATEEFTTVYYNQSKYEFEVQQIAIEYFYPYNITQDTYEFTLSQNYSEAIDLEVASVEGYYFDESNLTLNAQILGDYETIEITAPAEDLSQFQFIMVIISFNKGAYSDFTQIRLTESALNNHPESQSWSMNDSLWIDYEYNDLDYFLLFEDYDVGSDESWFEYIDYIRNDKFVDYEPFDDSYTMINNTQEHDLQPFVEHNDKSHVIEFYDYNMDAEHELIVEKQDLTGDGVYDSFKYGQTNAAGEITFHTLIQVASYRTDNIRKVEDEKENPKSFQLDSMNYINKLLTPNIGWDPEEGEYGGWGDLIEEGMRGFDIWAKKEIKSESTITSNIEKNYYLIQEDIDLDGNPDREMTYEQSFSTMHAITYTRDKTSINFKAKPIAFEDPYDADRQSGEEYIKQYLVSEYEESFTELSVMFRDFEGDEVVSSRFYKDIFPNELTEMYDLSQYYITAINDGGDSDPFNDMEAQVIELSPLLTLSHEADNIPAMFDLLRKYEGTFTSENILSSLEDIIVPGTQFDLNDFTSFASDVVKIIPREGVYYDNALQERPELYEGGSYFYIDGDGEGSTYETLFIADKDDNIIGVGFDYDYDHYFTPHKRIIVKNHIRDTFLSEDEGQHSVKKLIQHELLGLYDEDFNGYSLDPTFSDALFDLWKTVRSEGSTALFEEVSELTFNQFMESLTPEKVQADIVWGTASLLVAMAVGSVVTAVGGPIAGAIAGGAVYAGLSILKGYNDLKEQENILKAYTYHSEEYRGTKTLSRKEYYDDMYGDTMSTGVTGNQYGVYMPAVFETKKNRYEGQVILSPFEYWKTTPELGTDSEGNLQLTSNLNKINIDYYLQSRNYMGYSDFDDKRVEEFLDIHDVWNEDPDYLHAKNSLIYLENAVAQATREGDDDMLDTVLPYMYDYYPVLTFVDSEQYIGLPEFYEDYPIIVAEDVYEENKETFGKFIKIWDPKDGDGQEIRITPSGAVHTLQSDIEYIEVYTLTRYEYRETLHDDEFTFDADSGTLLFDSSVIDRFKNYIDSEYENQKGSTPIVLVCFVKQYRSINDFRELSSEQMESIATMQSIQASLLEYMMQFQLAVESQSKMNEIAYTVAITVITTALTLGIGGALGIGGGSVLGLIKEPLEEVFVDPIVEAIATKIVKDLGGDEYAQMIASTLAESGREGISLRGARNQAQFNQKVKTKMDANTGMTKAEAISQVKAEIKANQKEQSKTTKVAKAALMTLSIFGLVTGFGGVFGGMGGLGITSLSIFFMSHGGGFIDFLERLREQEQLGIDQDSLQGASQVAVSGLPQIPSYNIKLSHISDYIKSMKGVYEISDTQKPKPSGQMIDKMLDLLAVTSKPKYRLAIDPATGTVKRVLTGMSMVKDNEPNNLDELINTPKNVKGISNARPSIFNFKPRLEEIVVAWDRWMEVIKDIAMETALNTISHRIFGVNQYLSKIRLHYISWKTKYYLKPLTQKKFTEIYKIFSKQRSNFNNHDWLRFKKAGENFYKSRFSKQGFSLKKLARPNSIIEFKVSIRESIQEQIADFLKIPFTTIRTNSMGRLFRPYLKGRSSLGYFYSQETGKHATNHYTLSTYASWICEIRGWDAAFFKDAIETYSIGTAKQLRDFTQNEFEDFQKNLENFIIEKILLSNNYHEYHYSIYTKNPSDVYLYRSRLDFTLDVFNTIYKSLSIEDKKVFTMEKIKSRLSILVDSSSFSIFGGFTQDIINHDWSTIRNIITALYIMTKKGQVNMKDFTEIALVSSREYCQKEDIKPGSRTMSWDVLGSRFFFFDPNKISQDFSKFSSYLHKVRDYGGGNFLANYFYAKSRTKDVFSASEFSKNPFSEITAEKNIQFTQDLISKGIVKIVRENDPIVGDLIKFAKDKKTASLKERDVFLYSLIKPSKSYEDQVSHPYVEYKALESLEGVFVIEAPVWGRFEREESKEHVIVAGHIDFIRCVKAKDENGKEVLYVFDYKPNLNIPLSKDSKRFSFINSIPQIAAYAIILKRIYGYEVKCVTFNYEAGAIYDPEEALTACKTHYKDETNDIPTWAFLVDN